MDSLSICKDPRFRAKMEKQKQTLRDAQAHAGESPEEPDRDKLIMDLLVGGVANLRMSNRPTDQVKIRTAFLPPPYLPSVAPLSDLKKVMIKDLVLETHHRGTYVVLRSETPAIRLTAIYVAAEDENDNIVVLELYNQNSSVHPDNILDEKGVVIVKEPYLKRDADGRVTIRVDHLSDVIFLHKFDERVPEKWRQATTEPDHGEENLDEQREKARIIQAWRMRGQEFFREAKDQFSIDCYTKAFELSPDESQTRTLCFVRALAYLRLSNYKAALDDLEHPLITSQPDGTSLFHRARALYGLGRYRECADIFKAITQDFPVGVSVNEGLAAAVRHVAEQERGQYRFREMQAAAYMICPPLLDHATYVGPLCIRETGSRGRGVFTTTAVKAGDLLLCEKALGYASIDIRAAQGEMPLLMNPVTDEVTMGTQVDLMTQVIQKVHSNPELLSELTNLYHGSYAPVNVDKVDGAPVVDSFLIERIIALNAFGSPTSTRERHHPLRSPKYLSYKGQFSCGIWPMSSYINHACHSNTRRSFIGDMMIVRASQDLEPNTEITMWYKPFTPADPKGHLPDYSHWGFECKCAICEDIRTTHKDELAKRKGLAARVSRLHEGGVVEGPAKIERRLQLVADTYTKPASDVPRLCAWEPALTLSAYYAKRQKYLRAIEWGLQGIEALGFVIEGGAVPRTTPDAPLVVKKWGMAEDALVAGWLILAQCYRAVAPELEAAARGYAKACYRICVGEDETFEETYAEALAC